MNYAIFPNGQGGVSLLIPSGELPLMDTALKDVPVGVPFKLVSAADLPADSRLFEAWEADFSDPDGHGIGMEAYWKTKEVAA